MSFEGGAALFQKRRDTFLEVFCTGSLGLKFHFCIELCIESLLEAPIEGLFGRGQSRGGHGG